MADDIVERQEETFPDPEIEPIIEEAQVEEVVKEAPQEVLPPAEEVPRFVEAPVMQAAPVVAKPTSEVKFFTTQQLRQAVNEGVITEDQMVDQMQLQNREQAKQEAVRAMQTQTQEQRIVDQLNEYRQVYPGWDQTGTQANQRATPEYQRLLNLGLSDNNTTKLLALEKTFGPMQRIKDARATQTRTAQLRDTTQEVGGRSAPSSNQRKKDPLDVLSVSEKRLYKTYIEKGVYQDWNAVRKEVKGAATQTVNPKLREKHSELLR